MVNDLGSVLADPDFQAGSPDAKRAVLLKVDPDFAAASLEAQNAVLGKLGPAQGVGSIRAEPGILNQILSIGKTVAPEVLPMAGLFAGGALGATAGAAGGPLAPATVPGGAAIGAGVGYGAGRQANRAIESLYNYLAGARQPDYGSPLQQAGTLGKNVLEGAGIEAGGGIVGKLGSKLGEILHASGVPGFGGMSAADLAIKAAADRQGITMPAGAATGSQGMAMVEAAPGRLPVSANQARAFFDRTGLSAQRAAERLAGGRMGDEAALEAAGQAIKADVAAPAAAQQLQVARQNAQDVAQGASGDAAALKAVQDKVDAFLGQFGPREASATGLGGDIQKALDAAQVEARGQVAPLFQAVKQEASAAGSDVPMTQTAGVAQRITELEQRLGKLGRAKVTGPASAAEEIAAPRGLPADAAALPASIQAQMVQQFGLDQPQAIAPDLAMELQKRLAAAARTAPDDVSRRAIVELRDAVGADLKAWADVSGTNVGPLRQQAAEAYKGQIVPYFSEQAPLRAKVMDVEPEQAAKTLLSLGDPGLVRDAMKFLPAETQNRVRSAAFDALRGLPPEAFDAAVGKIGGGKGMISGDVLSALLTPEQSAALATLRQDIGRYAEEPRGFMGPPMAYQQPAGTLGKIPGMADPQVAKLVNSLTHGSYTSIQDFEHVWNAVTPQTQRQTTQALLQDVLNRSMDDRTKRFSTDRFLTEIADRKIPGAIWERMLSEDQGAAMKDIVDVFSRINTYARAAAQPSGTTQSEWTNRQLYAVAGLVLGALTETVTPEHAAMGIGLIFAPTAGAAALYSKPVQGFLMRPRSPSATLAPLAKLLGLSLAPKDEESWPASPGGPPIYIKARQ